MFGTVDTWLLYKLCGVHASDYSNASRTLLYNVFDLRWDEELRGRAGGTAFDGAVGTGIVRRLRRDTLLGHSTPVAGMAGDQQAALFGQACFAPGMAKNTYGTGAFLLMNTGDSAAALAVPADDDGLGAAATR